MLFNLQKENERMRSVNNSLQAQIINNGKVLSDRYKASAKKEAIEKYGDEIISEYLESHKAEIIEQFRPEIEDAVILEYLKTHKSKANWDKANQKRSENCAGRTAAYLADLYNGLDTKEIAEKHGAVRGTIQRLLKINDSSDVERLMEAYSSNKELFGDATSQDMRSWLEARLNKKTESLEKRLAAARKLIARNSDN